MVTNLTFLGIALQGLIPVLSVAGVIFYFRKKERFSWKPVWIGAITFFIFTQIIEKIVHLLVLGPQPDMSKHALLLITYGPLAAGFFEESGRYLALAWLLKKYRERKDAIAYGIGHGGLEALLIGVLASAQSLAFAVMLNKGILETSLGSALPSSILESLQKTLLHTPFSHFLLGGLERIPAILMQIALSLFILYGIRKGKHIYLLYAILVHAAFDFVPALYQVNYINLWAAESVIAVLGIAAAYYIVKSTNHYSKHDLFNAK